MLPSRVPHRGKLGRRQARDAPALQATFSSVAASQPVGEAGCFLYFLSAAEQTAASQWFRSCLLLLSKVVTYSSECELGE